jgi:hypothetical protein
MKLPRPVYILLIAFLITLIVMTGCLLKQNIAYRTAHRKLLLQNDSLTGVTIELSRKIGYSKTGK